MAESNDSAPGSFEWEDPAETSGSSHSVGLKLYNSITDSKVEFIPADGRKVSWYICGPTVYDSSHIGHARNYMSFDILRRVISDYFGYNVTYVMNITDLDDKIIIRSHFNRLRRLVGAIESEQSTVGAAASKATADLLPKAKELVSTSSKAIKELEASAAGLAKAIQDVVSKEKAVADGASEGFIEEVYGSFDIQIEYLKLAQFYENEFFEDMDLLGIRRPDVVTRVSEYIEDIVEFVKQIIDNGFAYEANGSVYFDMLAFTQDGFGYRKTSPHIDHAEAAALLKDGEGDLAAELGKKRASDFALWKAAKPGEPVWPSPWGEGRPGWHIECSTMACDVLGPKVDINCGGVDLRFPHHDNQLAQSEAHYGCKQWVNYFLHTGHLHINGLKMSKSLKNFIAIRKSLEVYTAREMRLLFLLHKYSSPLDIDLVGGAKKSGTLTVSAAKAEPGSVDLTAYIQSLIKDGANLEIGTTEALEKLAGKTELTISYELDGRVSNGRKVAIADGKLKEAISLRAGGRIEQMEEVLGVEKVFTDFFSNVRLLLRTQPAQVHVTQRWNKEDKELNNMLDTTEGDVHAALLDSINTAKAMELLQILAKTTVGYISKGPEVAKANLLLKIAQYITRIFRVFGLLQNDVDEFGLPWERSLPVNTEAPVREVLDLFCSFRDSARALARQKDAGAVEDLCNDALKNLPAVQEHVVTGVRNEFASFIETVRKAASQGPKALFDACDKVRDDTIAAYGVRFEDDIFNKQGVSSWKLDDPRFTLADRQARQEEANNLVAAAEAKKQAAAAKAALEAKVFSITPEQYFKDAEKHKGAFSQYDEAGIPTHGADGKQLPASRVKKLKKEHAVHTKKHKAYLKKQESA